MRKFGIPDLIYSRMFLMHCNNPYKYLLKIKQCVSKDTFFALEEPNIGKMYANVINIYFEKFVDLILQYGIFRKENYSFGEELSSVAKKTGKKVIIADSDQPLLKSDDTKQMIRFLLHDLIPIFSRLGLAEDCFLSEMKNKIIKELLDKNDIFVGYCEMKQIFFI
ncbi:MAG: hypothetical protein PVI75_02500 [Gammaproteobacteria bacterium]